MATPKADAEYFLMQFTNIAYASAMVAALSQFLSSPRSSKYLRPPASAEVWSYVLGDAEVIERVDIYMNEAALKAATDALDTPLRIETRRGDQLPSDCILLIGPGGVEAWGVEEAQWHLLSES